MTTKTMIVGLAITAGLVATGTGAFAAGQSTRMADTAVTMKVQHAADSAVKRAAAKAATHEDEAVRAAVARVQQDDSAALTKAKRAEYKRGVKAGKQAASYEVAAPAPDAGVDQTAGNNDDGECHSFAGGSGICTETPEYRALCQDLWARRQGTDPVTGERSEDAENATREYLSNSCDQN